MMLKLIHLKKQRNINSIPFYYPFYSIPILYLFWLYSPLLHPIQFYSNIFLYISSSFIPFYSILYQFTSFYSNLFIYISSSFYYILCNSIQIHSIPLQSISLYFILFYSIILYSIPGYPIKINCTPFFLFQFHSPLFLILLCFSQQIISTYSNPI